MSGDGVDRWSDEVVGAVAEAIRAEDESGGVTYHELARAALAVIPEPPTPLAERDVRDWVRIAGRCAAETVDLLTQVLDAIPSGMPAVVELAAEWSDGLDQTEELAERVRAARDAAPLTAPPEADSAAEIYRVRQPEGYAERPVGNHRVIEPYFDREGRAIELLCMGDGSVRWELVGRDGEVLEPAPTPGEGEAHA